MPPRCTSAPTRTTSHGVANLLAATANPQDPSGVGVDRPSNALEARAAAKGQFTTLLLGLGAVALLVGAIGIANIMVISVLERRGEIGLRRALGATRGHITVQFLAESALLAAIGGVAGLALGAGATEVYAAAKHEPFVVPLYALIAAPSAGFPDRRAGGALPGREGGPTQPDRGAASLGQAESAPPGLAGDLLVARVQRIDRALGLLVARGGGGRLLGRRPGARVGELALDRPQSRLRLLDLLLQAGLSGPGILAGARRLVPGRLAGGLRGGLVLKLVPPPAASRSWRTRRYSGQPPT